MTPLVRTLQHHTIFLIPDSSFARAFLLVTILESAINIALEAVIIGRTDLFKSLLNAQARTPLAVYLAIFILAHLFQIFLAFDALRQKNTIQLIGLCWFNFAFLVYAVIQVPEVQKIELTAGSTNAHDSLGLLLAIPVVIAVAEVLFIYLLWFLFREFGWQVYKQIGADRRLKRMFFMYQIFLCVLKFDYFFFFAFSLQLILLVPSANGIEKILTIIALPITLLLLIVGYAGVRREADWVMHVFQFGLLSGAGYFVYKLFKIWQGRDDPLSYQNVFKSLTVFSVSCLIMAIFTSASALICLRNFGNGLKSSMDRRSGSRKVVERVEELGMHYHLDSSTSMPTAPSDPHKFNARIGNRMSID